MVWIILGAVVWKEDVVKAGSEILKNEEVYCRFKRRLQMESSMKVRADKVFLFF